MIITVALNPALDQTVEVEHFSNADTNRVLSLRFDVGGKGINIARALKAIGCEPFAIGLAPGARGRQIVDQLEDEGIGCDFVDVPGEVRTNITILDRSTHTHTQLALPGPTLDPAAAQQVVERVCSRARVDGWVILAGSIPPPGDPGVYVDLLRMAHERGSSTALDADGPIIEAVLAAGVTPTVLKINDHELARLLHANIETLDEALAAARRVHARGVQHVVVTMGREGAVAVTDEGEYRVHPVQVDVISAVGAGDAFLAGLIGGLLRDHNWQAALTLASAAAAAACMSPGTQLGTAATIARLLPTQRVDRLAAAAAR